MDKINKYKDLITGKALEKVDRALSTAQTIDSAKRQAFKEGLKKDRDMIRRGVRDNGLAKLRIDNAKNTIFRELQNNSQILNALSDTRNIVAKQTRNARVATGVGAGALALGAGAYGLKKLGDKKKQEKTAYDIINDRFEKIAGLSNVLSGKNVVRAINDVKAGKNVINTFKGNLKHLEPSARKATREAIGTMTKDLSTLKGRVGKEIAKTTGTYGLGAGLLAGGVHSFRKAKNKNEDK